MKVGVMIVGIRGATASTLVATTKVPRAGDAERYLLTERGAARRLALVKLNDLVWGGWDTRQESWQQTLSRHGVIDPAARPDLVEALQTVHLYEAVALSGDHAVVSGEAKAHAAASAVDFVRGHIRDFKRRTGVEQVVLLHLGAPARLEPPYLEDPDALLAALQDGAIDSAPVHYTAAAILEGAAVVDYTASATLEIPALVRLAERAGVPLAGRDGSTGQTLMKSVLAETFATRRLPIRGWYSTNILGNHDGLVLQDPRYADIKHHDKTALLDHILEEPVTDHLVDIRYYRPAGDEKEAWDAIDFETWQGKRGRLRVNWSCGDSLLATPALIDLIRLTAYAAKTGRRGLVPELGVFFKHPLGTEERRYLRLAAQLEAYLEREATEANVTPWR